MCIICSSRTSCLGGIYVVWRKFHYQNLVQFNVIFFKSSFDLFHMLAVKINSVVELALKLTEAHVTLYSGMLLNFVCE